MSARISPKNLIRLKENLNLVTEWVKIHNPTQPLPIDNIFRIVENYGTRYVLVRSSGGQQYVYGHAPLVEYVENYYAPPVLK